MLGKLHITSHGVSSETLHAVADLVQEAIDSKVAADASSRTALTKLQTMVKKAMGDPPAAPTTATTTSISTDTKQREQQREQQQREQQQQEQHESTAVAADNAAVDEDEEGEEEGEDVATSALEAEDGLGEAEKTVMNDEGTTVGQDSLLAELLDDDGDVDMTL